MEDATQEITLSPEQQALFEIMESTGQHLFITGRAGTGKSVLLRYLREHTKKKGFSEKCVESSRILKCRGYVESQAYKQLKGGWQ